MPFYIRSMNKCLVFFILLASALPAHSQDHTLDFYLGQALYNSPLLKDYQGQVAAAGFDSAIIRAGYGPQVTGSSVNTYAPVIGGYGYDNAISNGGNFSTLVGVNKTSVSGTRA
jgi:outer membrane protein TolC